MDKGKMPSIPPRQRGLSRDQDVLSAEEMVVKMQKMQKEMDDLRKTLAEKDRVNTPLMLRPFLAACHTLSRAIKVVTDRSLTTRGEVTKPTARLYPRRIVPWDDFPARQADIWQRLLFSPERDASTGVVTSTFASQKVFPSLDRIDFMLQMNKPISSEDSLRFFERDTVEKPVMWLMDAAVDDAELRRNFNLHGTVDFESHTNLGNSNDDTRLLSENALPTDGTASRAGPAANEDAAILQRRRAAIGRSRSGMADQFCIYRRRDGCNIPAIAIEYKAPHKLSSEEIITGLTAEIQPERDVINQACRDGESEFVFASKSLAAAVVTQLFSYMVAKGIQYGYICTGQVFVFLHITDDPTTVFYHVCVPNVDTNDDDDDDNDDDEYPDSRLQLTAVAQVFAFMLQAINTPPPSVKWYEAVGTLGTWDVEYDKVVAEIPSPVRKTKERASPYKPSRWRDKLRKSPIRTRSQCRPDSDGPSQAHRDGSDDSDDGGDGGNDTHGGGGPSGGSSPTRVPAGRAVARKRAATSNASDHRQGGKKHQHTHVAMQAPTPIENQPYCTHQCLLGLTSGGPVDPACPNATMHGPRHRINAETCRRLLAEQIARDRGRDADFAPMFMSGLIGALYKLRLTAYGYTLVAKAVENVNRVFLQEEERVYDRLRPMQGVQVPVCLGMTDIAKPLYGYGGVFCHILLLSWAGRSLAGYTADDAAFSGIRVAPALESIEAAFRQMHTLGVLHGDAKPRNILFDARTQVLMVVDFERSKLYTPVNSPLTSISQNRLQRSGAAPETKTEAKTEVPSLTTTKEVRRIRDLFTSELRCVVDSCARCLGGGRSA